MPVERENADEGERIIEARLAAIIDSSFDAVIAKDLNSVITHWNPAAERMFGYSADEAIGRSITMLIPPHLQSEETDIIRRIRANERIESYETVRLRKDGGTIFVSLTVSPIRNPRGEVVGASKIARDITQSKESERRIRVLLREINHRVKNQYAVILSLIRETGLSSVSIEEFQQKIRTRIASLAASHDLLVHSEWTGSTLAELVRAQLAPFGHEQLVTISGPLVSISPNAVQNLGMAFHELGTNSAKYGVLAGVGGTVTVSWSLSRSTEPELTVTWDEAFDEPLELEPQGGRGFGTVVLERVTPAALNGRASATRTASRITWTLEAPASSVLVDESDSRA
jgi:PAS domain S-box-containing protein